jgi:hypothetical protein
MIKLVSKSSVVINIKFSDRFLKGYRLRITVRTVYNLRIMVEMRKQDNDDGFGDAKQQHY